MPRSETTKHYRHIRLEKPSLPYVTNASAIEPTPHFVSGSHDVMTSVNGTVVPRYGTQHFPSSANQATDTIKRYFFWNKTVSASYWFISTVGADSKVYRFLEGTDTDWTLIHTCSSNTEPFDYVVSHGFVYFSNGTDMKKYNGTTVTNWGITGPATPMTATSGGGGSVPNHIGHSYVYAYGVAATGYVSDISPVETIVPGDGEDDNFDLEGARCTDAQCDEIHIYRTEDGGANLLELSNSPIANPVAGTWTLTDDDADDDLNASRPAPLRGVNKRPTGSFQPTLFAGRIWTFSDSRVFYSTLEENNTSVPEECFGDPDGFTNVRNFGRNVTAIHPAGDFLMVWCDRGIYKIGGDSLATFFYGTLSEGHGTHYRQNVTHDKTDAIWLDSSNKVLVTDGVNIGDPDLSFPIRPDFENMLHSTAQVITHHDALHSWILVMDGTNAKVFIYDLDLKFWMPPWTLSGITAIGSNNIYSASTALVVARTRRSMLWNANGIASVDDAVAADTNSGFTSEIRTNLLPISNNQTGMDSVNYIGLETGTNEPTAVSILVDDLPASGSYTDITADKEQANQRVQGSGLLDNWYWNYSNVPPGIRASVKVTWSTGNGVFHWTLYSLDLTHEQTT